MQQKTDNEIISIISLALDANNETDTVEFKDARRGVPEDLWKSITAFSNKQAGGGVIVFGVEEDKDSRKFNVVGLPNVHDFTERLTNYFNDTIVNADRAEYRSITLENKPLIAMVLNTIQEEKKPCYYSKLGMDRGACIRDGNTDRPITDDELRHFIRNSSSFKYDLTPVNEFTVDDLDDIKIQKVLKESGVRTDRYDADHTVNQTLLENMTIAVKDATDILRPTIAGVLVFSREQPQLKSPFNRYVIRCVRYAGSTPSSEIIDSHDVQGTLDQQIDTMMSFILRNIARKATIEGAKRIETYEYPEEAIREIVANAVIHRDYAITESYTQVRVFSDRIEVINPGNLPPGVSVDNIKEMQFSRNSVIASLMRDLNYLEEYGRGIDLVFSTMRGRGLPRPIFRNTANMFSVTLLGDQFMNLTDRQLAIWQIILNKSKVSSKSLAEQLGISKPPVIQDLNKLIELRLVASVGAGPHLSYEIGSIL